MTAAPTSQMSRYLHRVDALAIFPPAVPRVLAIAQDPDTTIMELEAALASDPVLAAGALSVANSASHARQVPIRSLSRAAQVLGMNGARELVLLVVVNALSSGRAPWGPLLYRHARLAAAVSRCIAARTPYVDKDVAYIAGLLHNLGLQLLLRLECDKTERVLQRCAGRPHSAAIRERFGFTHSKLSAACMAHWRLPQSVCTIVASHQEDVEETRQNAPILVLSVAVSIAHLLSDGAGPSAVHQRLAAHRYNHVLLLRDGILRQLAVEIVRDSLSI